VTALNNPPASRYAGVFAGCLRYAIISGRKSHKNEVWCSHRFFVIDCALPPTYHEGH